MILFDGHVHIYDCFDLDSFFRSAFGNFSTAGKKLQTMSRHTYYMLFAEAKGCYYFKRLKQLAYGTKPSGDAPWRVEKTGEFDSLYVYHEEFPDMRIVIAAGRQIITAENLELLALLSEDEFDDGLSLDRCVEAVTAAGGVPVCPWGVGKWLGGRGKVLRSSREEGGDRFFLGDNGGRPPFWPVPSQFWRGGRAEKLISGSDPLPLPGEERKAGSFGGILDCDGPKEKPASFLRDRFKAESLVIQPYGKLCSPLSFFKNQIGLRLRR